MTLPFVASSDVSVVFFVFVLLLQAQAEASSLLEGYVLKPSGDDEHSSPDPNPGTVMYFGL